MTLEELKKAQRELLDKGQNEFIDKIFDMVQHLNEKANRKDYEPTVHEKIVFQKIYTIIKNMGEWF